MYLWELFGLTEKEAAKVAGTVTWLISTKTENRTVTVEDVVKELKEAFKDFSSDEKMLGWYLAGTYILSAEAANYGYGIVASWYREILHACDDLKENVKKYEEKFTEAVENEV